MMRVFALAAGLLTCVLAQNGGGAPQLNYIPSNITAGNSYTLSWSGGDSTPVTIKLLQGSVGSSTIVGTIAENIVQNTYTWATDSTLVNGNGYSLMLEQNTLVSTSPQFAISGGRDSSVALTSSSTSRSSMATQTPTSSTAFLPPSSSQTSNSNGTLGSLTGNATNPGLQGHQKLSKGGIIGIIMGLVAIFAALATLGIFTIASKALAKKGAAAAAAAAEGHDNAGTAPLAERGDTPSSRSVTPVGQYFKRKAVGSIDEEQLTPGGSTPRKYSSSLDSPETLVPTPARRMPDFEDGNLNGYDNRSRDANSTQGQGRWDDRNSGSTAGYAVPVPSAVAYPQYRPVSQVQHPGMLVPQYTGDTMIGGPTGITQNGPATGRSHMPMPPQQASYGYASDGALRAQLTGETVTPGMVRPQGTGESSRSGKERRLSPTSPPVSSKLRLQVQ